MEAKKCIRCGEEIKGASKYCKACQAAFKRKGPGGKCRLCRYSTISHNTVYCDYLDIAGHSRGCSAAECGYHKEAPRTCEEDRKIPITVQKPKVRKNGKEAKALFAAIMEDKA